MPALIRKGLAKGIKMANAGTIPIIDKHVVDNLNNSVKKVEERKKLETTVRKAVTTLQAQRADVVRNSNLAVVDRGAAHAKFTTLKGKVDKHISDMRLLNIDFNSNVLLKLKKEDVSKVVGYKCHDDIVYYGVKDSNTPQTVQYRRDIEALEKQANIVLELNKKLEDFSKKLDTIKDKEDAELEKLTKER